MKQEQENRAMTQNPCIEQPQDRTHRTKFAIAGITALVATIGCFGAVGHDGSGAEEGGLAPGAHATLPDELKELQGDWRITASEEAGVPSRGAVIGLTYTFAGDQMMFETPGSTRKYKVRFQADAAKRPKQLAYTIIDEAGETVVNNAIYEVVGDTLKLCGIWNPVPAVSQPFPKSFETAKDEPHSYLFVLKRSTSAATSADALKQLRSAYEAARDVVAGQETWNVEARRALDKAGYPFLAALLNHWATLPDGAAEAPAVRKEITTVFKTFAGNPLTERYVNVQSFVSRTVWPLLAAGKVAEERVVLLAELTEPSPGIRLNDEKARDGNLTEPYGWDVQAAHALALIRSGEAEQARDVTTALQKKVTTNCKANSKGRLDYGPEAGEGRYRDYIDYVQLCKVLSALQLSISGDREEAATRVDQARKLRGTLSPEAAPLADEVARRTTPDED